LATKPLTDSVAAATFASAISVACFVALVRFSYVVLPAIHAHLEGPPARRLLQQLFPHYYLTGIVSGLIALAAVAFAPPTPSLPFGERVGLAVPVAFALLCSLATAVPAALWPRSTPSAERGTRTATAPCSTRQCWQR
jgi:hypothetical protein